MRSNLKEVIEDFKKRMEEDSSFPRREIPLVEGRRVYIDELTGFFAEKLMIPPNSRLTSVEQYSRYKQSHRERTSTRYPEFINMEIYMEIGYDDIIPICEDFLGRIRQVCPRKSRAEYK